MPLERRKFERVECYLIARQTGESQEEEDFFGTVRNLSAGGALIEAGQTLPPGAMVELAFLLDEDHQFWEGKGQVVWAREKNGKIFLGLQFSEPLRDHWEQALA